MRLPRFPVSLLFVLASPPIRPPRLCREDREMAAAVASAPRAGLVLDDGDRDVPKTRTDRDERMRSDSGCDLVRDDERKPECLGNQSADASKKRCAFRSDRPALKGIGKYRSRSESLPTLQNLRQILEKQQSSQTVNVKSPMSQRVQLRATFVDIFFPKSDGMTFPGFEFIVKCSQQSQACLYALDVACLLHISFSRHDDRLQHHAKRLYPMALTHLRRDLEAPNQDMGSLIATIYILQLCEQFAPITTDGQGWRRHAQGLLSIIDKCQPGQLEPELQALLCANARAFALWDGILRRKPLRPCKDLCDMAFSENSYGTGSQFNDIATLVPAALSITDKLCAEGDLAAIDEVARCIQTIQAIERRLTQWFETLYKGKTSPLYWLVHQSTSLPITRLDLDASVFPHAYVFSKMPVASIHDTCWICILALRGAQLDLYKHFPLMQHGFSEDYLRRSATHYADNLCMSVAYVSQPKQNYSGLRCTMAPLQMAAMYYKSQAHGDKSCEKKLRYCEKALESLKKFGLFPPEIP